MIRSRAAILLTILIPPAVIGQSVLPGQVTWPVDLMQQHTVTPNIVCSIANIYECKLDVYSARNIKGPAPTIIQIHGSGANQTGTK
jgi:hypothetical protein